MQEIPVSTVKNFNKDDATMPCTGLNDSFTRILFLLLRIILVIMFIRIRIRIGILSMNTAIEGDDDKSRTEYKTAVTCTR